MNVTFITVCQNEMVTMTASLTKPRHALETWTYLHIPRGATRENANVRSSWFGH